MLVAPAIHRETEVTIRLNEYQQPIGAALPYWSAARLPSREPLVGRYCRLERIDVERHAVELYEAYCEAPDWRDWTYLLASRSKAFSSQAVVTRERSRDTAWYSIIDTEYPTLQAAYARWLDERNFDGEGGQIERLADLIAEERASRKP